MYGMYCRLNVHIWESNLAVIRAASLKLKNRFDPNQREARHKYYKCMLEEHKAARDLALDWRL